MVPKSITVEHNGIYMELNLKDLVSEGMSIYELLSFVDISDIEKHIEDKLYQRLPRYPVKAMLRFAVAYYFYGQKGYGYEWVVNNISEREAKMIGFDKKIPSKSLLNDFILHRIGYENIEYIVYEIAKRLNRLAESMGINYLNHDSTPIEASRYDNKAEYNLHYKTKMYKAHITMKGTIPLIMTFSNGNENDSPFLENHLYKLRDLEIKGEFMNCDAAYDSYKNHALIKHVLGCKPNIDIRENAVIQKEGSEREIKRWCQKLWKKGGYKAKNTVERLEFLFNNGRIEQVGMYYRNKNIVEGMNDEEYKLRSKQEFVHSHIKRTVKFDVRRRHHKYKKLHILWSFLSYQIMLLCSLQNGLKPNEFGFIKY